MKRNKNVRLSRVGDNMLPASTVGVDLRKIRLRLDISQELFGKKIGLSRPTISVIERGKANLLDKYIPKIVKAFKLTKAQEKRLILSAKKQRNYICIEMPYTESPNKIKMVKNLQYKLKSLKPPQVKKLNDLILSFPTKKKIVMKKKK